MNLGEIPNRDVLLRYVSDNMEPLFDAVEVGTDLGAYFLQFLTIPPREPCVPTWERLYLIDTWDTTHFYTHINQEEMEKRYISVVSRCIQYNNIYPLRGESVQLSRAFRDNSLSYVYIDAQHHYEAVRDDAKAWLPKVKRGGIYAGHDHHMSGVAKAVKEVLSDAGYKVYETWEEEARTWYTMKV